MTPGSVGCIQSKGSGPLGRWSALLVALGYVLACSSYTTQDNVEGGAPLNPGGPPPPGCDLNLEPKDSPACISDALGFFVDAERGNDSGLGTRAQPFKTINKAAAMVGDKLRVFVCAGTYSETLRLGAPIKVFGGFACDTWVHRASIKVEVKASEPGPALLIRNGNNVNLTDLRFISLPGTEAKPGSIAAVIRDSEKIRLVRVSIESGAGFPGTDGVLVPFGLPAPLPGTSTKGPTLVCPAGDSTAGGDGGNGQSGATAGQPGPLGGGIGSQFVAGGDGKPGIAGVHGEAGGGTLSIVEGEVFTTPSKPGRAGGPGGGGGGNQGYIRRTSDGSTYNERGGSGGSGGCGGAGGSGGTSGGYSIALLTLDSSVALEGVTAVAGAGGSGGNGAVGQDGTPSGGTFGSGSGGRGGRGGAGAKGGTGGGGAGGASVALAWWKIEPTKDDATVLTHAPTAAKGGTGGNPGPEGAAVPTLTIP